MKKITDYIIVPFLIIIFILAYVISFCSCIKNINRNKNFVNMILKYYPEYKVEIIESDPNSLIINIKK